MAEQLNKHLIDVEVDGLVVGGEDKHQCGVTVAAGQNLKRGAILALDENDKAVILGTEAEVEEGEDAVVYGAKYILAEDCDASEGDEVAIAYDRVTVIKDKCLVKEGYTLSSKDIDDLRARNIFFEDEV